MGERRENGDNDMTAVWASYDHCEKNTHNEGLIQCCRVPTHSLLSRCALTCMRFFEELSLYLQFYKGN